MLVCGFSFLHTNVQMFINLTRESPHKLKVDVTDEHGNILLLPRIINRFSERDIRWLRELNREWDLNSLNDVLTSLCENDDEDESEVLAIECPDNPDLIESKRKEESERQTPFVIHVREINQLKKYGTAYSDIEPQAALVDAFNNPPENAREPLIEWTEKNKLCCLDIDYHELPLERRPTREHLETILSKIKPQPFCWHHTHGKGIKLYYVYTPMFTADELASVAGLMWKQLEPVSTFDLIKSTRHPCYARSRDNILPPCSNPEDIKYVYGSGDVSQLKRMLTGNVDYSDIEEFLESKGWKIGQTLPHTECLIDPNSDTKESVFVGDTGIFCHRCQARGFTNNGGRPGWTSYSSLIGTYDNKLAKMVRNFVHLEHARIVLQNLYKTVPADILSTVYKILLKITHSPDDPRVFMAMTAGKGFIRSRGQWISVDGEHVVTDNIATLVRSLPCVLIPTEKGFHVNVPVETAFKNSCDLSEYGYYDITFVRGCEIYGQFLPKSEFDLIKVVTRREFYKTVPQYIPPHKRMPKDEAWATMNDTFPGIDQNYLKLLIATKGASEGRLAQCPFLLITGPSGAGKSTTVHIAAGICGDKAEEPIFHPQVDRFRQALMDASQGSSFICVNEVFKLASRSKLTATQALDPMLSLTEDSRSHVLYVGSRPFGRLPVFVLTDIDVPREVESDIQLSRRFTFYRLNHQNFWSNSFVNLRIRPHEFRLISTQHNDAANSILSEVIDDFFTEVLSIQEIARRLTVTTLATYTQEVDDTKGVLHRFYVEVCNAPPLAGSDQQRYPGLGWRKIDRINMNNLTELWTDLCDGEQAEHWQKSRTISSQDWAKIVGVDFPIICELRPYRNNTIYVRFRSTDSVKCPAWVNGQKTGNPS